MTQLVPSLTITERIKICRTRELPVPGAALCAVGDYVTPETVVCRGEIAGEIVVVNPADELGISSDSLKENYLIAVGDKISEGDILVSKTYFFKLLKNEVRAPISGTIAFITAEHGRIGIQMPATIATRIAYCGGQVTEIGKGGAVTLVNDVSLVQGIFGVGGERVGKIYTLPTALDALVLIADLPTDCSGLILVGGMAPASGTLKEAAARGAQGFVCGSVTARMLQEFVGSDIGVAVTGDEPISMSLIVTEGFGEIAMSQHAYDVLALRAGCAASFNGTTQVRAGAVRPEIVVPILGAQRELKISTSTFADAPELIAVPQLKVGSRVRLIRYPYFGLFATVTQMPEELCVIETGARVRVLKAVLSDAREVTVPRTNIELLQ